MKIKRNIAMSLIKDLIQDEKFKKEMIDLISSTSDSSGIARHEEKKIFNNLLKVHKKNVDDVMVPRGEIIFIDEKIDKENLIKIINRADHFPRQPVMPGVLIVEAFGQAAAALTAYGIDPKEYKNKLVYLMGVDKARFRNPVIPDCELHLEIEAIRSHGRVWKYKGTAKVDGKRMADAEWSATIVDRKE